MGWPHKIEQQMEQTETQLEEDIVLYCIVLYSTSGGRRWGGLTR